MIYNYPHQKLNINKLLKKYSQFEIFNVSSSYEGVLKLLLEQRHASLITNRKAIVIHRGGPFVSKTELGSQDHGSIQLKGTEFQSFVCCLFDADFHHKVAETSEKSIKKVGNQIMKIYEMFNFIREKAT